MAPSKHQAKAAQLSIPSSRRQSTSRPKTNPKKSTAKPSATPRTPTTPRTPRPHPLPTTQTPTRILPARRARNSIIGHTSARQEVTPETESDTEHTTPINCPFVRCRSPTVHVHPPVRQWFSPRPEREREIRGYVNGVNLVEEEDEEDGGNGDEDEEMSGTGDGGDEDAAEEPDVEMSEVGKDAREDDAGHEDDTAPRDSAVGPTAQNANDDDPLIAYERPVRVRQRRNADASLMPFPPLPPLPTNPSTAPPAAIGGNSHVNTGDHSEETLLANHITETLEQPLLLEDEFRTFMSEFGNGEENADPPFEEIANGILRDFDEFSEPPLDLMRSGTADAMTAAPMVESGFQPVNGHVQTPAPQITNEISAVAEPHQGDGTESGAWTPETVRLFTPPSEDRPDDAPGAFLFRGPISSAPSTTQNGNNADSSSATQTQENYDDVGHAQYEAGESQPSEDEMARRIAVEMHVVDVAARDAEHDEVLANLGFHFESQ